MLFFKQIEKVYKGKVYTRCDDNGIIPYFSCSDFKGLNCEPYPFSAFDEHRLSGYIYSYNAPSKERMIILEHGMGSGHRGYMKEIEMLARHGYTVFAYDHTGCMESEGENTNGLCQSICDLDACLTALKNDARFAKATFSVVGHSWGGFSAMNIVALHPDITHIVAVSGFISVKQMIKQSFSGIMKGYVKHIYAIEEKTNPKYIELSAEKTLKNSDVKALLIYSSDDGTVDKHYHYDILKNELKDKENIKLLLVDKKGHNPHYTEAAVKAKDEFFSQLSKKMKANALNSEKERKEFLALFDFDKITEQDENIWKIILEHLEK